MAGGKRTPGLTIRRDDLRQLEESLELLTKVEILVGWPSDVGDRQEGDPVTNATLAYIHDNGDPAHNIPARPFMVPAVLAAQDALADGMFNAAKTALKTRDWAAVLQKLSRVGVAAELSVKNEINRGVPPPLSEWTLRDRARRGRVGAQAELDARAAGASPSVDLAKPLVDTGQMRNSVKYVIRPKRRR